MADVSVDQFEWEDGKLVHLPTGARFAPDAKVLDWGRIHQPLAGGDAYDPVDVGFVAGRLVLKSPRADAEPPPEARCR
jgi:hypothetical protein